jgi:hypothetical protein
MMLCNPSFVNLFLCSSMIFWCLAGHGQNIFNKSSSFSRHPAATSSHQVSQEGDVPGSHHLSGECSHGPLQGGCCQGLATTVVPQSIVRLLGACRLLPQVYCRLRHGGCSAHRTSQPRGIQVNRGSRRSISIAKASIDDDTPTSTAQLRQAFHHRLPHLRYGVRHRTTPRRWCHRVFQ